MNYKTLVTWDGNLGSGTSGYREYGRDYTIEISGKPTFTGSADPAFRGDAEKYNPEDMLLASISACHMLWYLHLCADARLVVTAYEDSAEATMEIAKDGRGQFTEALLHPKVTLRGDGDVNLAKSLHKTAHAKCFIANSLNFPVACQPEIYFEKP
jgi:organic hydroperoxide reductase OsmC/OhrA